MLLGQFYHFSIHYKNENTEKSPWLRNLSKNPSNPTSQRSCCCYCSSNNDVPTQHRTLLKVSPKNGELSESTTAFLSLVLWPISSITYKGHSFTLMSPLGHGACGGFHMAFEGRKTHITKLISLWLLCLHLREGTINERLSWFRTLFQGLNLCIEFGL